MMVFWFILLLDIARIVFVHAFQLRVCNSVVRGSYFKGMPTVSLVHRSQWKGLQGLRYSKNKPDLSNIYALNLSPEDGDDSLPYVGGPGRELVEELTALTVGSIVEVVHNNQLHIAVISNNISADQPSLPVTLSSGRTEYIHAGQIVSVWDDYTGDDDSDIQDTPADNTIAISQQGRQLLDALPPYKKDLQEFWASVTQARSSQLAVDSFDVAVYLFQESRLRRWLDPYLLAEDAMLRPITRAQRFAAAALLFYSPLYFKRRPSSKATPERGLNSAAAVRIREGGYRIQDEATVLCKKASLFEQYYTEQLCAHVRNEADNTADPCSLIQHNASTPIDTTTTAAATTTDRQHNTVIARILRQLELYALSAAKPLRRGDNNCDTPSSLAVPRLVKLVLKRLHLPVSAVGAREVLVSLRRCQSSGHRAVWSSRAGAATASSSSSSSSSSSAQAGAVRTQEALVYTPNLAAWSPTVVGEAQQLAVAAQDRQQQLSCIPATAVAGERASSGHMDYRRTAQLHPALCVDAAGTSFRDDAFSLSPGTGELLVHVVDVASKLQAYPALQEAARERIATSFPPAGPTHMLPPTALNALTLSADPRAANEVLTIALSVDHTTGEILSYRVFPALLGAVFPVDMRTANEIIAETGAAEEETHITGDNSCDSHTVSTVDSEVDKKSKVFPTTESVDVSERAGFPPAAVHDLVYIHRLVQKMCVRQPWLCGNTRQAHAHTDWELGAGGRLRRVRTGGSHSHLLVDALLSLYSAHAHAYCTATGVDQRPVLPVPIAWENRDRQDSARVSRFATQPLRNWLSQLQQRQLRAAMHLQPALTARECAQAVRHHQQQRRLQAQCRDRRYFFD